MHGGEASRSRRQSSSQLKTNRAASGFRQLKPSSGKKPLPVADDSRHGFCEGAKSLDTSGLTTAWANWPGNLFEKVSNYEKTKRRTRGIQPVLDKIRPQ